MQLKLRIRDRGLGIPNHLRKESHPMRFIAKISILTKWDLNRSNQDSDSNPSLADSVYSIYLDYNATTPLSPEVLEIIQSTLSEAWGNPASSHPTGRKARTIIDKSRQHIADMLGSVPEEIIFLSGGTEANNMVIHTAMQYYLSELEKRSTSHHHPLPHIITSNLEHDSVKKVLENLQKEYKIQVTFVAACMKHGHVLADDIVSAVRPNTALVTLMHANNETGIIQPISEITRKLQTLHTKDNNRIRILMHTDAAQTIGKIPVSVADLGVDYLTVVGHKFYGPRVGGLYVRDIGKTNPLYPMFFGGGQERNYRPGTENTGMIAGLGKAAELVVENLVDYKTKMLTVRDYLEKKLKDTFGSGVHINGFYDCSTRLPNVSNFSLVGEQFVGTTVLSRSVGISAGVGSACHSQLNRRASPILLASGVELSLAVNALRFSVGRETSKKDIDTAVDILHSTIKQL